MVKVLMNLIFLIVTVPNVYAQPHNPASIGIMGDPTDIQTKTTGGIVLIGGGGEVPGAFKWMIERSGGGDVVIIRATGDYLYHRTIDSLGKVNSIETLRIGSRELANNEEVANTIRNAEMLFITGGDQSNYMRFWRGTKVEDAINYLMNQKKVPVGGTSAGCAILTGMYYSGENRSATSAILKNPYDSSVTIYNNDFLEPPFLSNVISDQHYVARKRQGRHVTFLARIMNEWNRTPFGIAPDERTAVCINEKGKAIVIGEGNAYFISARKGKEPENLAPGVPLQWYHEGRALKVYELTGTANGNGSFDVRKFNFKKAGG
ncbi:MAG: cyanophycinase, partial [Chitinophagaceae bacterium]